MLFFVIFLNIHTFAGSEQSRPSWVSPLYHPMIYDVYLGSGNENTTKKRKIKFVLSVCWSSKKEVVFVSR